MGLVVSVRQQAVGLVCVRQQAVGLVVSVRQQLDGLLRRERKRSQITGSAVTN